MFDTGLKVNNSHIYFSLWSAMYNNYSLSWTDLECPGYKLKVTKNF